MNNIRKKINWKSEKIKMFYNVLVIHAERRIINMKIVITVATYYPLVDGVQNITEYYAEGLSALGIEAV